MVSLADRTPVEIAQFDSEFDQLIKLYREIKPARALEIGTWHGGTLFHWLKEAPKPGLVVAVDLYQDPVHDNRAFYSDWVPMKVGLEVIKGDSTKPRIKTKIRKFAPYQWAFIDGDHSYDVARSDFDLCLKVVEPGGIIALHDIVPPPEPVPWMEVDKLWQEIKAEYKTKQFIATPYQTWAGIGVVFV